MLKSEHVIYLCGILSVVLLSVTFITLTGKFILKTDQPKSEMKGNQIYDPDYGRNFSQICLLAGDPYSTPYSQSPCRNATVSYWYLPWVRETLWKNLWRKGEERRRQERLRKARESLKEKVANQTNVEKNHTFESIEIPVKKTEKSQAEVLKQKPSEVLYTILVALVMISAVGACWEAFRNKFKKDEGGGGGVGGSGVGGSKNKDCSLAEFTINRHLRRESQQQQQQQQQYHGNSHLPRQASLDIPAKVTQTLIHQSSLDRALPKSVCEVTCKDGRRNSMPVNAKALQSGGVLVQPSFRTFQRQHSLDVSSEESLSDMRKKPRFFIRRH